MRKILLKLGMFIGLGSTAFAQVHFSDDFSAGIGGWTLSDADGDGNNWLIADYGDGQGNVATSESWRQNVILTPNNWMISGAIDLTGASAPIVMEWVTKAQDQDWPSERYSVYVNTSNNTATMLADGAEFTEVLTTTPGGSYVARSIDLSAFAGSIVHVAFRHHDVSDEFRINIDDVMVRTPLPNDARLNEVLLSRYSMTNTNNTLELDVTNLGTTAITSLTVDWNDGTSHSSVINANIAPGQTAIISHPTPVNYASAIESSINVQITNVNGGADNDPTNNEGASLINTLSFAATKSVLIEEGTGTWCQWCPRGKVAMEYMTTTYPNFIGIMVHNGDPMALAAYDNAANFGGYPSANVDRVLLDQGVSQTAFEGYYNARKDLIVPASLSATVSGSGSSVTIDASATFYTQFSSANYRLGVILYENGVTGTSAGYNQSNAYAGGGNGPMGGFENLPNPVPAAQMVYDYVGRALLGGYNGQAGSVPTTITDGQQVSHSFNYTVPATSDRANLRGVVVLIDQSTGEVVNAQKFLIAFADLEEVNTINVNVYPNPANEVVNVAFEAENTSYSLSITDISGKVLHTEEYNNLSGGQVLTVPVNHFTAGNYFINLSKQGETFTRMFTVK